MILPNQSVPSKSLEATDASGRRESGRVRKRETEREREGNRGRDRGREREEEKSPGQLKGMNRIGFLSVFIKLA